MTKSAVVDNDSTTVKFSTIIFLSLTNKISSYQLRFLLKMAFEYLGYSLFRSEREPSPPTVDKRVLRNVDNPFHLGATEFKKLYRLSPNLADDLVWQLDGQLRGSRVTAIKTEKQVTYTTFQFKSTFKYISIVLDQILAALRFFATGCYQRPVGEQWGISMSQSSISRSIHRVTDAIYNNMFCSKVRFPMTQVERQAAKEIFASASSPFVAGTIGAIDCSHISILSPKNHEEAYVNHHGYHSINVQMVRLKFYKRFTITKTVFIHMYVDM